MVAQARAAELTGRRIALLSLGVGVALSLSKLVIGMRVGSAAVISDGVEAAADVVSSGMVYAGFWLASKPPDEDHPYGHGRYETLAGLGVGAMLFLTSLGIFWHSATAPSEQSHVAFYALYPLIGAVICKVALAITKLRIGRRIGSAALHADAWHDVTDLVSTSVALVAVGLTLLDRIRFTSADQIGGMVIGIIVFFLSVRVVRDTVDQLVDTMPEAAKMEEIRQVALSVPGALGIEKCFARRTGLKYHVDLHLEVDPEMTVRESHVIAAQVRSKVKGTTDWVADVLVHVEPSPVVLSFSPRMKR